MINSFDFALNIAMITYLTSNKDDNEITKKLLVNVTWTVTVLVFVSRLQLHTPDPITTTYNKVKLGNSDFLHEEKTTHKK